MQGSKQSHPLCKASRRRPPRLEKINPLWFRVGAHSAGFWAICRSEEISLEMNQRCILDCWGEEEVEGGNVRKETGKLKVIPGGRLLWGFPSSVLKDGEAAGEGWEDAGGVLPRSTSSCTHPRALLITVK